jgi:UDP-N-acetylmuramoyl-tripeptide--D-alanyl-D-alanine ligase
MNLDLTVTIRDIMGICSASLVPARQSSLSGFIADRRITAISTDSRRLQSGNLFVAVSGENFDGHDYVLQALHAGAAAALVSDAWANEHLSEFDDSVTLLVVSDVLAGLQALASWYRTRFEPEIVGVTGSSGKTTTKNMIAAVLSSQYSVLKTPGNLNSQLGLPQVIFQLRRNHDMAVLEMGMNHMGEINRLAEICNPSVGVITNVGPVHLEFLGTIDGVARAKGELLDHLSEKELAVLNADDALVMGQRSRSRAKLVTFGLGEYANVRAREIDAGFSSTVFALDDGSEFLLNIPGVHHVVNALAAIAVGQSFGVRMSDMQAALAALEPSDMRMDVQIVGNITYINDTYNANPDSVRAALGTLAISPGSGRRIAVLGDMLELGKSSLQAHRDVGAEAAEVADVLITVGNRAIDMAVGARAAGLTSSQIVECATTAEASGVLENTVEDGDVVLVKGSRGMRMEEIVAHVSSAVTEDTVL